MDTKMLAGAIVGFLLGGLVVSIAATVEDDGEDHSAPTVTTSVVAGP